MDGSTQPLMPLSHFSLFLLRLQRAVRTQGPEGATYEFIRDYTEDINHLVDSLIPDAAAVSARVSSSNGNVRITLKDIKDRSYTQMDMAEKLSKAIRSKTKARSFVQQQSSFGGRRGGMPVQYVLQTTSMSKLEKVLPEFLLFLQRKKRHYYTD